MKTLSIAILAALSLLSFAGCKKKGGGGEYLAKMTEFKDQMCKCTDRACADNVTAAMTKWTTDNAKAGADKNATASEEDTKKMTAVTEEMSKCMQKLMTPPAAAAPPAGDKPADPAAPAAPADPAAPPAGDKPADPAAPAAPPAGSGSN
jgi:hypothetical protein